MTSSGSESGPRPDGPLHALLRRCRADEALLRGLRQVYRLADRAAADGDEVCLGGGACCKFDLADHRLYVSTAELALLTAEAPPDPSRARRRRCPYQKGPICTARARRPLGCRTFFCSPRRKLPLQRIAERLHRQVRMLHERHCIPYSYADLCEVCLQLFTSE